MMSDGELDVEMMGEALVEAQQAAAAGEVPVGAVLVVDNKIIARAGNNLIAGCDPVGHAEIRVLRQAGGVLGNYRCPGTTLYVSLEPCLMCAGAMVHARIERLVFGAADPKSGAVVSCYDIRQSGWLNHSFSVTAGILSEPCGQILKDFFQKRRKR
jgi:tRNA(adenine34) deaminase